MVRHLPNDYFTLEEYVPLHAHTTSAHSACTRTCGVCARYIFMLVHMSFCGAPGEGGRGWDYIIDVDGFG